MGNYIPKFFQKNFGDKIKLNMNIILINFEFINILFLYDLWIFGVKALIQRNYSMLLFIDNF